MREFSWTGLFFVTSFCFFAFVIILELLNHTHPGVFIWIGCSSLLLGILNIVTALVHRVPGKDKRKLSS